MSLQGGRRNVRHDVFGGPALSSKQNLHVTHRAQHITGTSHRGRLQTLPQTPRRRPAGWSLVRCAHGRSSAQSMTGKSRENALHKKCTVPKASRASHELGWLQSSAPVRGSGRTVTLRAGPEERPHMYVCWELGVWYERRVQTGNKVCLMQTPSRHQGVDGYRPPS